MQALKPIFVCWLVGGASLFAEVGVAEGKCRSGDGCKMAKDIQAVLEPAESCILVGTKEEECTCEGLVSLENTCRVNLSAEDFSFGSCKIDNVVTTNECPAVLPPGSWGRIHLPIDPQATLGDHEDNLHLSTSGKQITLKISYQVVAVESGCGCGISGSRLETWIGLVIGGLLVWGWAKTRRRRRPAV